MDPRHPAGLSPMQGAPERSVRAAWIALACAGALALALHAEALPGLALDAGAPVWLYRVAQGASNALAPLSAPRDALADAAAALRPEAF